MARAGQVAGLAILVAALVVGCAQPPSPSVSASTSIASPPAASASGASSMASAAASTRAAPVAGWERLPTAPIARLEMAVTAHQGRIWLAGGLSALGSALTDVEILDPGTGEWSEGPALPAGLHHAALVSDGERLLLIGGYLGSAFSQPTDLVLVLEDEEGEWVEGPSLPEPRAAGAAAWDGDRVVYAGGVEPGGSISPDVIALVDGSWVMVDGMVGPREHLAATSDGAGRTWLMGGRLGGLDTNVATVEVLEGGSISLGPALTTPRGGVAAFYDPEVGACLTGGEAPDRAYIAVECVTDDGALRMLPDLAEPHHGHGAAVVDRIAYVVLGGPEPTLSAGSTVEALDLAALER
jgi:non-specific serine/threonine protein kinase